MTAKFQLAGEHLKDTAEDVKDAYKR